MNICVCLLVFALGSNVAADLIKVVLNERESVTVPCPRPVDGDVTWSRETNGVRRDILRVVGDRDVKLVCDPFRRFSSLADKSLHIFKAVVSDTATYFCNNESAAELTVIPRDSFVVAAAAKTSVVLLCPPDVGGSDVATWSRDVAGKGKREFIVNCTECRLTAGLNTLTIRNLQPDHAGLYFCDGKPVAYLNVTTEQQTDGAPPPLWPELLSLLPALLLSVVIVALAVSTWRSS